MSGEESVNIRELEIGTHIIFKKHEDDSEECAKIKTKETNGYGVKQYFNGMLVTGEVEFNEILRVAKKEEISKIKGSQSYDLSHKSSRGASILGFQSNIINTTRKNGGNGGSRGGAGGAAGPGRLRGLV
tara:strand:- start:104 stop:490 length:387 start_codon:yes stop_codon:yes gene_type:complete